MASTLWQARRARAEARKAQKSQAFIISILRAFDPHKAGGKTITQRDILERGEGGVAELGDQPEVQALILEVFAETWYGMDEFERARGPATRALAIEERVFGKGSLEAAKTTLLGEIHYEAGDYLRAQTTYENLIVAFTKLEGDDGLELARTLSNLAGCERRLTRFADAERHRRRALDIYKKRLGEDDPTTIDVTRISPCSSATKDTSRRRCRSSTRRAPGSRDGRPFESVHAPLPHEHDARPNRARAVRGG